MGLIDDASEMSGIGVNAIRHVLAALTADGPVILLPDEGEGVRVAKLADGGDWAEWVRDWRRFNDPTWTFRLDHFRRLIDAAREVSS